MCEIMDHGCEDLMTAIISLELVCKRCKSFLYNLQESGLKEGTVAVTNKQFTDWTMGLDASWAVDLPPGGENRGIWISRFAFI